MKCLYKRRRGKPQDWTLIIDAGHVMGGLMDASVVAVMRLIIMILQNVNKGNLFAMKLASN